MNRSDALWELIGDHLTELVRLRRQEQALQEFRDVLLHAYSEHDQWIGERLDQILHVGQK